MRRKRKEEDYYDKYKGNLESNSDESDNTKSSPDDSNSDEEKQMIRKNEKEESMYEGLGDDKGEI